MEKSYEILWKSSVENDDLRIQEILSKIENIDNFNLNGWNAIILAAFNHSMDALAVLIQNGANINSTNANGTSVFMYAKTKCLGTRDYEILDFLLANDADINHRDNKAGWTVLQYVQDAGDIHMVEYLKNNGAVI